MQLISKATASSSAVLLLTVLHHFYGAVIYSTPWRMHVAFLVAPALVTVVVAWLIGRSRPTRAIGRISKWVFIVVAGIVSFGMFGLYEGGYNHLLKDVLFFGGASSETMLKMFPPPMYEMPNDFFFELTGVAQFFVGIWAGRELLRLIRSHTATDDARSGGHAGTDLADAVKSV